MGGLSYETTDDGLKEHFENYGEIVDHIVMKDPQTKRFVMCVHGLIPSYIVFTIIQPHKTPLAQ